MCYMVRAALSANCNSPMISMTTKVCVTCVGTHAEVVHVLLAENLIDVLAGSLVDTPVDILVHSLIDSKCG